MHQNLMGEPAPTLLPAESGSDELAAGPRPEREVAAAHPTSSLAWAILAERSLSEGQPVMVRGQPVMAYAYAGPAITGDSTRCAATAGRVTVRCREENEPNQGFLRALAALGAAAEVIGEDDEWRAAELRDQKLMGDAGADAGFPAEPAQRGSSAAGGRGGRSEGLCAGGGVREPRPAPGRSLA